MAEKEIVSQIEKLRKTRPARAVEAMVVSSDGTARNELIVVLGMLRDDLKDEARLVEQAKIKGGLSIMKDRLAVAGWLELFIVQLGRESDTPSEPRERLSPSHELTEHRPSERGTPDAVLPGAGGRCAVGNIHDAHTVKCPCGLDLTRASVTDYLSGASDEIPGAAEHVATLPNGSMTINFDTTVDAATYIGNALEGAQQAAHATIDQELAHVTAEPIVDPFAPILRAVWAPATPPNGKAWTALDLLAPVDAASLPAHLSYSQATTVGDCGAKYRMQRIANVPQVPQWANVGGKAFHVFVEAHERGVLTSWDDVLEDEILAIEQASGMTREQFRASGQGREGYDWWRVEGAAMLQRYVDWRLGAGAGQQLLSGPSGGPMLEWETTYDVDGVPFKTILDSVWATSGPPYAPEVSAVIRDWKTGSMTPDNRQLCTQAWGLRKAGWQGPILVQFFDARKGTFSEPFDPFDVDNGGMSWDDVRYFVLSADAQRRLPILPARPSDFCGGCSVAYACPIMSQRKAPKAAAK